MLEISHHIGILCLVLAFSLIVVLIHSADADNSNTGQENLIYVASLSTTLYVLIELIAWGIYLLFF
mgnify:CR=1 FL=1